MKVFAKRQKCDTIALQGSNGLMLLALVEKKNG